MAERPVEPVRIAGRGLEGEREGQDGKRVGRMDQGGPGHRVSRGRAPIAHGGDLDAARLLFPGAPEPWIDLSTGINPVPYPLPPIEASAFRRLPPAGALSRLREAASVAYGCGDPACLVPAPGTQILIEALPRLRPPGRVAVIAPTYEEHEAAWRRGGHHVAAVPRLEEAGDADVVVLVNPNNPDGRTWPAARLLAFAGARPRDSLLVVDEAFADLVPGDSLAPHLRGGIVVLRSFGKTYGLAGIRLGFALAEPDLAARIAASLGPWAVSGPALAVGTAALADHAWRLEAGAARGRDAARLDRLIERAGGSLVGGTTLFRTADFPDAAGLFRRLGEAGIYVRRFEAAPARLRFGLPADKGEWCRLARILK
ncbi:Histidinol-phosphate aminotransferase [Methylobacterium iners]|uniref:8-amino-7-oxononanoate synthase n=2 Tax=Methylobacterium iners TaxID=418707 RepID=A0ABQ4S3M1_9HYPH|nr:Histidinol-phosphate aminotransferase [Methylobacterium iners]